MSDSDDADPKAAPRASGSASSARTPRFDMSVFEDGPDVTSDERGTSWGERDSDDNTARLLRDRPPHWG